MPQESASQKLDAEKQFKQARQLSFQKRFDEAQTRFRALIKAEPENADYLLGMAQTWLWRGEPEKALPWLRRARRLAPAYADIWRTQIQALLALGDPDRLRQAVIIREEARLRFPHQKWRFDSLDISPQKPALQADNKILPLPVTAEASAGALPQEPESEKPNAPVAATSVPTTPTPQALSSDSQTAAQSPARKYNTVQAGVSLESLSNGLADWKEKTVYADWTGLGNGTLFAGARETSRYGFLDREGHIGIVTPIHDRIDFRAEAGFSPNHHVLAKKYASLQWTIKPVTPWSIGVGWRRSQYSTGFSRVLNLGAETYVGKERITYTFYAGGPDGAGLSPTHRLQWGHSFTDTRWIGISLVKGRETEYAGLNGFRTSRVQGFAVSGGYDVVPGWDIVWSATTFEQGTFYTRTGASIAFHHHY